MGNKISVDEFTTPSPYSVAEKSTYSEIFELMSSQGIRHLPVVQNGLPIGLISDRDIHLLALASSNENILAEDIMTKDPFTVYPDTPIEEVALEMSQRKIGSAIVTSEDGKVTGIFTATDALNALVEVMRGDEKFF